MVNTINLNKTRCIHGHEFTEENTYRNKHGWRECRTCKKAISKASRKRNPPKARPRPRPARKPAPTILGLPVRVWARLTIRDCGYETPCLVWTGTIDSAGYGNITIARRSYRVHRLVYETLCGPLPKVGSDGKRVVSDHLCRNRACANPTHIDPVNDATNVMRGVSFSVENAAKTHCIHGHEFTPENTYTTTRGHRNCRACRRAYEQRKAAEARARRAA